MLPKVSVAVITYNQKELLRECLDSTLVQDYPNIEIVVADDGSTDGTQAMLREYAAQHPGKFRLELAEKNAGITANSNRAFHACTGEYLAWMGGDDLMLPGKISRLVAVLEADKTLSMAITPIEMFESESGKTLAILPSTVDGLREYGPRELIRVGNCIYGSAVLMRRSMCPPHGCDPRIPVVSDFLHFVETAMNGQVRVVDEVLSRYRIHANQVSNSDTMRSWRDIGLTCQIIEDQYPQFMQEVNLLRAKMTYWRGVRFLSEDKVAEGRLLIRQSLRHKMSLRVLAHCCLLLFPTSFRKRLRHVRLSRRQHA